jgi:predicted NAD-dependent protein-ADP-ribosyltransferase YbiA (DUF1768 family)
MADSVKEFSFLNRWFIFKRVGEVGVSDVPKITLPEPSAEEERAEAKGEPAAEGQEEAEAEEEDEAEEEAVVSETGARLPPRDKKFSDVEVFRFGIDARQADILGVKDDKGKKDLNIGRWMGIAAPFPIPDPDDAAVKYPTIEHYLAAMKFKLASNRPNLAKDLMSTSGKVHQDFALKRRAEAVKQESPRDFDLLAEEATDVRKKMTKTYLNQYRVVFDDNKWIPVKDKVLMDALKYRYEHDKRFRDGVEAARGLGKYLLYSTKAAAVASELGGVRSLSTGIIEGDNKVGRFIMEIAGFKF